MEQEVLQRRNAVFNRLYYHSLILYKSCVPVSIRWLMEINVLLMALTALFLWGYVHFTYITSSEDCLASITERPFPSDVILQVEIYTNSSEIWYAREKVLRNRFNEMYSASSNFEKEDQSSISWITEFCETNFLVSLTGTNFFCHSLLDGLYRDSVTEKHDSIENNVTTFSDDVVEEKRRYDDKENISVSQFNSLENVPDESGEERKRFDVENSNNVDSSKESNASTLDIEEEERKYSVFHSKDHSLYELFNIYNLQFLVLDYTVFEFSQEPGYLSLTDFTRAKLNISVVKIYVDPYKVTCFGGPFGRVLSKYFLGYDMMVISSFKGLLPPGHGSGYVKNLLTGSQYFYKVQWMGKWRYGAGLLPALFFTLVASVLLRQVHYHIFKFLTHFNHLLNQGIPMPINTGAQIPFLVVTYATIGLVIVMSEALSDDSVFSLLMVGTVWEVDQFYSVYCKQETSKIYLPWFFFLYHFLPYAYYIRFNGQFWFIPFLFHWLLLQHAMLFFLHHCELPAIDRVNHVRNHPLQPHPLQPHPAPPVVAPADPIVLNQVEEQNVVEEQNESTQQAEVEEFNINQEDSSENYGLHSRTLTSAEELDHSSVIRTHHHRTISDTSDDGEILRTDSVPVQETTQHSGLFIREQRENSDDALRQARLQHLEKKNL